MFLKTFLILLFRKLRRCLREVIKKLWKSGQADRFGGGQPPPARPLLFVKILGLFTHWIWFIDTQNRFYFIVKRLKNGFSMYLYCLCNCHKTAKPRDIMECLKMAFGWPPLSVSLSKRKDFYHRHVKNLAKWNCRVKNWSEWNCGLSESVGKVKFFWG